MYFFFSIFLSLLTQKLDNVSLSHLFSSSVVLDCFLSNSDVWYVLLVFEHVFISNNYSSFFRATNSPDRFASLCVV